MEVKLVKLHFSGRERQEHAKYGKDNLNLVRNATYTTQHIIACSCMCVFACSLACNILEHANKYFLFHLISFRHVLCIKNNLKPTEASDLICKYFLVS